MPDRPMSSTRVRERPEKRDDQLRALIEHCTSAQTIADGLGEKFLAYMLAMTIQAARGTLDAREAAGS